MDIFGRMNALAAELGAVNLGHGFPEDPPIAEMLDAAVEAIRRGENQYSPSEGLESLRAVLARRGEARGVSYDPNHEITVTAGCTEALAAGLLALAPPGSEILALEPFYDTYPWLADLAGARLVAVQLEGGGPDREAAAVAALRAAVTPATRVLLLNTPHNPTGAALARTTLEALAELAGEHDLVVLCDEVYEEFVYDGRHERIAALDGMRERTIVCSSATKTLSVSGWRVGWAYGPPDLTAALRDAHRSLTFCAPTPLQAGVAAALEWADATGYFDELRRDYVARRDILVEALTAAGLDVAPPAAGCFVVANVLPWSGGGDVADFAVELAHEAGVVAIPLTTSVSTPAVGDQLLRFAFCKEPAKLEEAARRLRRYAPSAAARSAS